MLQRIFLMSVLVSGLVLSAGLGIAEEQQGTEKQTQNQEQEQIFGSELMTPKEREEYRGKIHAAKTAEKREEIRQEHHIHMKERAKERGLTLPDMPPENGMGHMKPGVGMGPGGGKGPGEGPKR
ncbi:MAG TPA: hypothetical protein VGB26_12335 [Nitrospiria bacterium]|jgi:hypothetical protein